MLQTNTAQEAQYTPEVKANSISEMILAMREVNERYNGGHPQHNKPKEEEWTDEQRMAYCPRNEGTGYNWIIEVQKTNDGQGNSKRVPYYCNLCPGCVKANSLKLRSKFERNHEVAIENTNGHWRVKRVSEGNEAKALKKMVQRNQDGRHQEFCASEDGHTQVWTWVSDDTPQDELSKYGDEGNWQEIDWLEVYKNNRLRGKKFSVGKPFRRGSVKGQEGTERIIIAGFLVNGKDAEKAERIVSETNLIEEADTFEDAKELFALQTKYIVQELEKEGIEVIGIKQSYLNVDPDEFLKNWNTARQFWMSIFNPLDFKNNEAKVDIGYRLHYLENENTGLVS